MSEMIELRGPDKPLTGTFHLPLSKSLINRQLILAAQAGLFPEMTDPDLPEDVRQLAHLLTHPGPEWDAGAGGTTLRFLTAYLALHDRRGKVTGTARMQERPIAPLVNALIQLGADIEYGGTTGCPPIHLNGFTAQSADRVELDPSSSSQFLTALLLAAPGLPHGMTIHLTGPVTSRPYLDMTLAVLNHWGVQTRMDDQGIHVAPCRISPRQLVLEADWTAASYAYGMLALAPEGSRLHLPRLYLSGLQGDEILATWMTSFGIRSEPSPDGITIIRDRLTRPPDLHMDMADNPDLAQTMAVLCALSGIGSEFSGLHTLRIKETDRTLALQMELRKMGVHFAPVENRPDTWRLSGQATAPSGAFSTYHDHRMAMAFSLASLRFPCQIEDPSVVDKSFPAFWQQLEAVGFRIKAG